MPEPQSLVRIPGRGVAAQEKLYSLCVSEKMVIRVHQKSERPNENTQPDTHRDTMHAPRLVLGARGASWWQGQMRKLVVVHRRGHHMKWVCCGKRCVELHERCVSFTPNHKDLSQ